MTVNALIDRITSYCKFADEGYGKKDSPYSRSREEAELAEALLAIPALGPTERASVRAAVNDYFDAGNLAGFAFRCASFALRMNNAEHLRHGILALIVDADAMDLRYLVTSLSVLNEAAERLGVNLLREVIDPLLEFATPNRKESIETFFARPDGMKRIEKFGVELANIEGFPWFRGTRV